MEHDDLPVDDQGEMQWSVPGWAGRRNGIDHQREMQWSVPGAGRGTESTIRECSGRADATAERIDRVFDVGVRLLLALGAEARARRPAPVGCRRRDHVVDVAALRRDVRVEEAVRVLGHELGLLLRPLRRVVDGLQPPAVEDLHAPAVRPSPRSPRSARPCTSRCRDRPSPSRCTRRRTPCAARRRVRGTVAAAYACSSCAPWRMMPRHSRSLARAGSRSCRRT